MVKILFANPETHKSFKIAKQSESEWQNSINSIWNIIHRNVRGTKYAVKKGNCPVQFSLSVVSNTLWHHGL